MDFKGFGEVFDTARKALEAAEKANDVAKQVVTKVQQAAVTTYNVVKDKVVLPTYNALKEQIDPNSQTNKDKKAAKRQEKVKNETDERRQGGNQ